MRLAKLHALGNDFLVAGPEAEAPEPGSAGELARRACDRHTGVGADGLIVLSPREGRAEEFRFRIFNSDGSEAELSGNGLRCAAAHLVRSGTTASRTILFQTAAGPRSAEVFASRGPLFEVRVGLGAPRLASRDIPFDDGQTRERVVDYPLTILGQIHSVTCLSVGNPHCGLFFDHYPTRGELRGLGAEIESHPFFPQRTNVEFIRVVDRGEIEVRFWERGVGETLASGTGSAAAAAAAILKGRTGRSVTVRTALGSLRVKWPEGGELVQTGPAEYVFSTDFPAD